LKIPRFGCQGRFLFKTRIFIFIFIVFIPKFRTFRGFGRVFSSNFHCVKPRPMTSPVLEQSQSSNHLVIAVIPVPRSPTSSIFCSFVRIHSKFFQVGPRFVCYFVFIRLNLLCLGPAID